MLTDIQPSGPQTSLETRLEIDPLAQLSLSDQLLGPYQHRQCEARWPSGRSPHDQQSIQRHVDHLLHFVLALRAANPDPPEALPTLDLFARHNGLMGNLYDVYGIGT